MKRHFTTAILGLSLCPAAVAAPSLIYENYGTVIGAAPVVDATAFYNAGDFEVDTVTSISSNAVGAVGFYGNGYSAYPYETKDTLSYTNTTSGFLLGEPGFRFDTSTSKSRHNAKWVVNWGTIWGIDTEAFPVLYSVPGGTTYVPDYTESQPIASQILAYATSIVNQGVMAVGNYGLIHLEGKYVTNYYGTLTAGTVNTGGFAADELDTTGLQGQESWDTENFYVNSPGVYDLFWGVSNTLTIALDRSAIPPNAPPSFVNGIGVAGRGRVATGAFPVNANPQWGISVFGYAIGGTNIYYNMVFVNTNFGTNKNLSAAVGFNSYEYIQAANLLAPNDANGREAIVQFSEPVVDVITGATVTNAVYLIDDGAYLGTMTLANDAGQSDSYARPNAFETTTATPGEWLATLPGNVAYDPTNIYTPDQFANKTVGYVVAEYGAQIGRNTGDFAGSFESLIEETELGNIALGTNEVINGLLVLNAVNLPDPTNDLARIEINAGNLDLTRARMRAEGMVILNVTNLVGAGTGVSDYGEYNANINATSGALVISNFFPTAFSRVRGDIYAWSASWQNTQTNIGPNINSNNPAPATNQIHYHMLVVDQNLFGTFQPTARNLTFTGKKSIVVQDPLNVVNKAVFTTPDLNIDSTCTFTENAANFTTATTPNLKNLFINTNGALEAESTLDVGYKIGKGQSPPAGRSYTVNTITNFGLMYSTAPLLQSAIFENDGIIGSVNGGSIVIEANVLGLGQALTNTINYLYADGNVTLSANTIKASNSVIYAGFTESGELTLDVSTSGKVADFVSSTPTTNTSGGFQPVGTPATFGSPASATYTQSAIVNNWTVTDGFSLAVKPATGDLFGTEITTIATNNQEVIHVWAGTDKGATASGFSNNMVIGHLVLDRQTNTAILHFSGAGTKTKYAMYVDYLELTNYAYSDYRNGLVIDPNMTIYFAGCNGDPEKMMEVYPQMVWVYDFTGPNSTVFVPVLNCSNVVFTNVPMNTNWAYSFEITNFFNGVPNYYDTNWPYILNNPTNPCLNALQQLGETTDRSFVVATPDAVGGKTFTYLQIAHNGLGSITPALKQSQIALGGTYTLTATPAKGWTFDGWSTTGLGGNVDATSETLSFTLVTNALITANFKPPPFYPVKGVYNGLFFQTNAVDPASSGGFTLTLALSGRFSGRLLMGPSVYSFSSQFPTNGIASSLTAKCGANSLSVNLQLDMTGQTGRIVGDVNGGTWDAPLTADIAAVWTAKNPSPLAGTYTVSLPWNTGTVSGPGGDGYGVATVSKEGELTLAGMLADGAAFSQSAPVSSSGSWPFHVYAASRKDSVLGWLSVGANGPAGTNITWSKPAGSGPLYGSGFNNTLQLIASPWRVPAAKTEALNLANPAVVLSGGDLTGTEPLTIAVALEAYLSYAATDLTLSIKPSTGVFNGWFDNPGTGQKETMAGVVLQDRSSARGFFLGTSDSGAVLLESR